jgi:hypothetical protein
LVQNPIHMSMYYVHSMHQSGRNESSTHSDSFDL